MQSVTVTVVCLLYCCRDAAYVSCCRSEDRLSGDGSDQVRSAPDHGGCISGNQLGAAILPVMIAVVVGIEGAGAWS